MALTVTQREQYLGNFLRLLITHIEQPVAQRYLEPMASALANAGKVYVLNGTMGTQAERREAMETMFKGIYAALGYGNANDGARGQHGFENHWFPSKQRGE